MVGLSWSKEWEVRAKLVSREGPGTPFLAGLRWKQWQVMVKKSTFWEIDGGEQGAQPAGAFTSLINGTAAGTPSVCTTDGADLIIIQVSLSLGGCRRYCCDSVLSQSSSPEVQGNSWVQRCISAPWASAWLALILGVHLCIGTRWYLWYYLKFLYVGIWAWEP